jgi:SEC-C motif-containing protein
MRSRYAAFARGLGPYLVATLAQEHPDRVLDSETLARELSRAKERQRFLGLVILHSSESEHEGEVLFYARIFERGSDRSFAELSTFARQEGAWKYASGLLVPGKALPAPIESITRASFLALARA